MSPTSIRDASECNTSIRYDKFPPTEIHLSPRNKENFQMKTVSSRPCTESGAIIRSTGKQNLLLQRCHSKCYS